ncbi:MAG: polysaccharide biosynthesis protein [Draconibacterium sp.]|nr:MAG: polysaccharide biosynthesis protein [Draconibacterium sp.]
MGIIIKQSIKGAIWSYLGVAIGFVTTAYLFPKHLSADIIGLFSVLLAYSILFSQIASLGFNGITSRLFPYFRNPEKQHNGYTFIAFANMLLGISLFLILFFVLKPYLIASKIEKSALLSDYIWLLIPLTGFTLLFVILDEINKLLYNAVFGRFLQEFLQRTLIFSVTILFIFNIINLHQFILAYVVGVSAKGLIIFMYLLFRNELHFKPQLDFITPTLKRDMISVALFNILSGAGSSLIFQLDKIIINKMLGLGQTGIYTIAFFFGTLVIIPSRTLLKISGTLIADAWKREDTSYILKLYKQTCINQFILALFLFGGIWINIDNILTILPAEYAGGRWVIFFIGLGYVIDMATGANGQIIAYSKYYRSALWFVVLLIGVVVLSLMSFVPIWGIVGAAISIAFAFFVNNLLRFLFLYKKYGMQPFTWTFVWIIAVFLLAYGISYALPTLSLVPDILLRSTVFTIIFISIILKLKVSEEINQMVQKLFAMINKKWKS